MDFFSTYKLYKQGTSQVVAWLGKTAARCGYELGSGGSSKLEKKSDIPKEQEKKATKTKSKSNGESPSESESQVTKYKVAIRELPVLARVISKNVQQMSEFKTLPDVLEVLKDVIVKRKQYAKTFRLPDAKRRHMHVVTVLAEVYQILGGAMSALQVDKEQTSVEARRDEKSTSMEATALSNLFAVLDIEEPVDQVETTHTPARSGSPSRPATITYELEDEKDGEEVYFMIYCFFNDFQAVRNHIRQSWADYVSGKLDLPAVAITTNVALEMLQRAQIALLENLKKYKKFKLTGYEEIARLLIVVVAGSRGVDPNFLHREGDIINMDLKDVADFVSLPVYILLSSFLPVIVGRHIPVMKSGFYGQIDTSGKPLSWRDKFNQDKIVLLEFLPEFCILKEVKMAIPAVDELSCGLMEMVQTKVSPIWIVFACQIYVDIHHTMLSDIDMAHKELQAMGLHVSKTLQDYFNFSKDMSIESWSEDNDKALRLIKLEADLWVNQDLFGGTRKRLFQKFNPPEATTRPYSLLSRHPILCGLMLFRLCLKLEEAGVALVTAWGSLPSVMHLYNALKHESSEDGFPLWQDVQSIIEMQGKDRIFVGDYPKNAEEYYKTFSLAMGYTASMFARNRRLLRHTPQTIRQNLASKRGPRDMIITSTIADIFRDQYCGNETRSEVTFSKLEKLFSTSSLGEKFGVGRNHRPRQFTSVSFLSTLEAHIQSDILALNIDYFALHIRSFDLLRAIHGKLDLEFCKFYGPGYLEKESQLAFLVGYLFQISEIVAKSLKVAGPGDIKTELFAKVGEVVKQLVQKEGDREKERVRSVCRAYDWLNGGLPPLTRIRS